MTITVAGIQARMGSTRLPGKSLADVVGKPMLQRVVERASAAKSVDAVVVLTSTSSTDDPLAQFCESAGIQYRRGSEADVLSRYLDLVDEFEPDYLVRITGDCPLISSQHIDFQLEALLATDADFTAHPPGVSSSVLEGQGVLSVRALRLASESEDPRDREHVGSFFFATKAADFRTVEIFCAPQLLRNDLRLAVDEEDDLELIRAIYANFSSRYDSLVPLELVLDWLDDHPELSALNRRISDSIDTRMAHQQSERATRQIVGRWPPA